MTESLNSAQQDMSRKRFLICVVALFFAISAPWLQPYASLPVPQLNSNATAVIGWSLFLLLSGSQIENGSFWNLHFKKSADANFIFCAGILFSLKIALDLFSSKLGFPSTFASAIAVLTLTLLVAAHGFHISTKDESKIIFKTIACSLLFASVCSAIIGWLQFFDIRFPPWVSPLTEPGRVFANVRQPNQLASLLAIGIWSACWLRDQKEIHRITLALLLLALTPCLVFTGSRMAILLLLFIACWGVYSEARGKTRLNFTYAYLILLYTATWYLAEYARQQGILFFHGGERISSADPTGLRWQLWKNSFEISLLNPIMGCGFNQFNFCFMHAPLDPRAPAAFDHAHNIILQWAVEHGWPLTIVITLLAIFWFFKIFRGRQDKYINYSIGFLGIIFIHSMLEHPLWYAAFLMPTAFLIGFSSGRVHSGEKPSSSGDASLKRYRSVRVVLLSFILTCSIYSIYIHTKIAKNYDPSHTMTAAQRHENTKASWIFSPQIAYAQAMYVSNGAQINEMPQILEFFKLASHAHMDGKFLIRYAQVAALAGDFDLARHLAWRSIQIDKESAEIYVLAAEKSENESLKKLAAFVQSGAPFNLPFNQTMRSIK